ncbi:MAG: ATP-binding protein [Pseudoflavonifractor sp.]
MTPTDLCHALWGISAYRNLLDQPLMGHVLALLTAEEHCAAQANARVFYCLRQEGYTGLGDWLWDKLRYEDAPYPRLLERSGSDPALEAAARQDVETLLQLSCLPQWGDGAAFDFDSLSAFYRAHGYGLFAQYRAFLWEGGQLTPVADPDCTGGEDLIGYERQRDRVIANTRALLEGSAVNNVLLYGDSGTGKSVTVKSLLAVADFDDLRLIEVQKEELEEMPNLIRTLCGRRQKFILFIDDLAFDQDDRIYSVLKTILEGGLERRPRNVAVYATSNRRHLVRQTFSDRAGDEVDASETIQEKTSLSDRFGLRVPYLALNKAEFLDMVTKMAAKQGIPLSSDHLRAEAVKFEARHPGRTPRTARQFIASLGAEGT